MIIHLVLLASGAARDEGSDKGGQTRPPEVTLNDGFGAEMSCMSRGGGFMQKGNKGAAG